MNIDNFFFDLDGTVVDTLPDLTYSVNTVLKSYGVETVSLETVRLGVGMGLMNMIDNIIEYTGLKEDRVVIADQFRDIYSANLFVRSRVYPGMEKVIKELFVRGKHVYIYSNKPHAFTVNLVKQTKLIPFLKGVYGHQKGFKPKPDSQFLNDFFNSHSLNKEVCAMVGDSDVDMKTGMNAGIHRIGVSWGYRSALVLQKSGAEMIVSSPEKLLQID